MKFALACATALLACGTAHAQGITLAPTLDARLRHEHVGQEGLPRTADALTLRLRPGVLATTGEWSALVEGEGVVALARGYNDGLGGRTEYPLVADPQNLEINRAQLRYARPDRVAITAGRQRIALADERFVGPAPWRQSEQTFDAVRVQLGTSQGFSADLTYSGNVRTIYGRDGTGARPGNIGGDNLFALASYGFAAGTLTGFAYLVDQDSAAVQGFRLSSQTWGLRFAGSVPISREVKIGYAASLARQSNWARNPNDYAATYRLVEGNAAVRAFTLAIGHEVLGAGDGTPLTSVQTPLASLFRFNGWAGKFGTTPPDGLRDLYGTLSHGWTKVGRLDAITVAATAHSFRSDRAGRHYGSELDLLVSARHGHYALSGRYAHYSADRFATDTDKIWVQLDWSL